MTVLSGWQPIETCPENTWVLLYAPWEDQPYKVGKFMWSTSHGWEVESETQHASGKRQVRRERIERFREWDYDSGDFWMPLPAAPAGGESGEQKE
jgi:hypothetical protein